jgi:hypothetical protein
MGMIEYAQEKAILAIKNREFCDFLCGYGDYRIPDRSGFSATDRSGILSCVVYGLYESDETIKALFEDSITILLNGNLFEFMTAFNYISLHKLCERRKTAPFLLDSSCIKLLVEQLKNRKPDLLQYKEYAEFGAMLPNGAWDTIQNTNNNFLQEYGFSFL